MAHDVILVDARASNTAVATALGALAFRAPKPHPTNGGVVRISQHHCDNNEVVELSVLRHNSKELVLLWIDRREELEANQPLALKDAADAHKALEGRATSGSTVLTIEPTVHRSYP